MSNEDLRKENEELKAALAKKEQELQFLLSALDNIPNPIFLKNEKAEFVFFNKKYEEAFGISKKNYIGKTALDLEYLPEDSRLQYHNEDIALIKSENISSYDMDFTFADQKVHPSFYWSRGFKNKITGERGLVGEIVDISKERTLQSKLDNYILKLRKHNIDLEVQTETDAGTGIYNKSKLSKLSVKQNEGNSIIMMDIDHFKSINDAYGHLKGDEILSQFSNILKNEIRQEDTPIRYGGEEFLVILNNCDLKSAVEIADHIRKEVEKQLKLPDEKSVTISMGVSEIDTDKSFNENIEKADQNLYEAKNTGRNRVVPNIEKN